VRSLSMVETLRNLDEVGALMLCTIFTRYMVNLNSEDLFEEIRTYQVLQVGTLVSNSFSPAV